MSRHSAITLYDGVLGMPRGGEGAERIYKRRACMYHIPCMKDLPQTWLVFRLSALGDVILTTGPLVWLHARYGWRFTVFTREVYAPLFANNPAVTSVISPSENDLRMPRIVSYFKELARKFEGWGLLDLHGTVRSSLLSTFWRGPVRRYSKYGFERRAFLASRGKLYREELLAADVPQRYALAVESEAPPASELVPRLYLTDAETASAKSFLASLSADAVQSALNVRVALHPYAAHASKAWPEAHWRHLVTMLDEQRISWLLLGRGAKFFPARAEDIVGSTDLRESAALLAASSVLVTGDSGPMHLAAAVGTPVVCLFGPTVREWGFYPVGNRDTLLESGMPCRPCSLHGKKSCPLAVECLTSIRPEVVMAQIAAYLPGGERSVEATFPRVRRLYC